MRLFNFIVFSPVFALVCTTVLSAAGYGPAYFFPESRASGDDVRVIYVLAKKNPEAVKAALRASVDGCSNELSGDTVSDDKAKIVLGQIFANSVVTSFNYRSEALDARTLLKSMHHDLNGAIARATSSGNEGLGHSLGYNGADFEQVAVCVFNKTYANLSSKGLLAGESL